MRWLLCLSVFLFLQISTSAQPAEFQAQAYQFEPDSAHGFLFVLNNVYGDLGEISGLVARYNTDYYKEEKLEIFQLKLENRVPMQAVYVKGFRNGTAAMDYHLMLRERFPDFLKENMLTDYYPVSPSNFEAIYNKKSVSTYRNFFDENYWKLARNVNKNGL